MTDTVTTGLEYTNGQLTPVSSFTHEFTPQVPTPDLQADLSASIGPKFGLLLYGVAGPEVNLDGSLALDVAPGGSPAWTLTGGLDAGGGLTVPILDFDESDPSIISYSADLETAPPVITATPLGAGTVGTSYSQTLTASDGTPPYTWSVSSGALPPGLSLDSTTGAISGTPTQSGSFSFTIQVTDSSDSILNPSGQTATAPESITMGSNGGIGGTWAAAIEVPGTGALNAAGNARTNSVSCASAGNCSAGGSYEDGSSDTQAWVASEVDGTWGTAIEVPGTAALNTGTGLVGGRAGVTAVSCASAGNCSAGGYYTGGFGRQLFVVSEVNGTWSNAVEVPGIQALNTGGEAEIDSMSCVSAGNCSAGGYYTDNSINAFEYPFVVSEVDGTWGNASEVPALGASNYAATTSVSCASPGNCSAGGTYSGSPTQAFVVSEVDGTWGNALQVPGTAADSAAGTTSVSCSSAGNCSAGGWYSDASGNEQAFVIDETDGSWGTAQEVPGTAALNFEDAQVNSVSCTSAGNCAAAGWYTDSAKLQQPFVVNEVNGTWGSAEAVPGVPGILNDEFSKAVAVSCASAGNCSVGGYYTDLLSGSTQQVFVANEVNGVWGNAEAVPGTKTLNAGGLATLNSLSCAPAGGCSAGGSYEDGSYDNQAFVVSQQ